MIKVRRKLSTVFAVVTVLSTLLANCVIAAPNEAEDVRNVVAGFATSWNRHDMDAFGKLFAPDADFVNVAGVLWTGRQSIQAQHAYSHGVIPADAPGFSEEDHRYYGIFKNSTVKFERIDERFLAKDVAIARVNWEALGDARTQNSRHGVFLFVLTRQNARWSPGASAMARFNVTYRTMRMSLMGTLAPVQAATRISAMARVRPRAGRFSRPAQRRGAKRSMHGMTSMSPAVSAPLCGPVNWTAGRDSG